MATFLIIYLVGMAVSAVLYLYYQFMDWDGIITVEDVIDLLAVSVGSWLILLMLALAFIGELFKSVIIYKRDA